MQDTVLILDFGSQYTQLIARRIRELGVYSQIKPFSISANEIHSIAPKAIILSGGPSSVTDKDAPLRDSTVFEMGIPILGLCYGMQLIGHLFGGKLVQGHTREYGMTKVIVKDNSDLLAGLEVGQETTVWMSHGDHVEKLPPDYISLAYSSSNALAAIKHTSRPIYGLQFHPEVNHTEKGRELLSNFLFKIVGLKKSWTPASLLDHTINSIKNDPSIRNVVCALSGGVDSTVAAVLASRALGERLHCIFVDNGLLRMDEAKKVEERLGRNGLNLNLKTVDASREFLDALKGVTDPEQKRKIIGRVFIDVFDREANRIKDVSHLLQGTLYPDVIESVSVKGPSATIKTHHNVGGLPEKMNLKLLEPLRELFKDEVRELGRQLELSDEVVKRQPFPGPGLAVRIIGEINADHLDIVRKADEIFMNAIKKAGLYESIWQSFCVLLPVKTVGVMGDGRTYENVIALRAVHSQDGMTAEWVYLPHDLLKSVSTEIVNKVKGVNRVVMDISNKPPATIEWE